MTAHVSLRSLYRKGRGAWQSGTGKACTSVCTAPCAHTCTAHLHSPVPPGPGGVRLVQQQQYRHRVAMEERGIADLVHTNVLPGHTSVDVGGGVRQWGLKECRTTGLFQTTTYTLQVWIPGGLYRGTEQPTLPLPSPVRSPNKCTYRDRLTTKPEETETVRLGPSATATAGAMGVVVALDNDLRLLAGVCIAPASGWAPESQPTKSN